MTELERALLVRCETCRARVGQACITSKIPAPLDGVHSRRMRLAIEGVASVRDERDEYNHAVRSRGSTDQNGWRRRR
jgi:hypothetical protein